MIQGNLKLTHTAIFYMAVTGMQFDSISNSTQTVINILMIVLLVTWPIFLSIFLTANRSKLDTEEFQQKYDSMFLGYKTDNYLWKDRRTWTNTTMCFLYNVTFSVRRLALVLSLFFLKEDGKNSLPILHSFLVINSIYFIYLADKMPHTDTLFNILEMLNAVFQMLTIYTLKGYITTSILKPEE